jgi:hypothetical protein
MLDRASRIRAIAMFVIIFLQKGKLYHCNRRGGLYNCEALRPSHFLDSRLTDGSQIVRLYAPTALCTQNDSWYPFLLEAESAPEPIVRLEGLDNFESPSTLGRIEPATFRLTA